MSFATGRSQLQQLQRSPLQQRGTSQNHFPSYWTENIWFLIAHRVQWPDSGHPQPMIDPSAPGPSLSGIVGVPWTAIPGHVSGGAFGGDWPDFDVQRGWSSRIDTDPGGWSTYHSPPNPRAGDFVNEQTVPLGAPSYAQAWFNTVNGNFAGDVIHGKVGSNLVNLYVDHPFSFGGQIFTRAQNLHMCACWTWAASADWPLFPDVSFLTTASWVQVQRARYKWNRPSFGFFLKADIWNRKSNDTLGWDHSAPSQAFIPFGTLRFSLENASVYQGMQSRASDTFIEPPLDFPVGGIPSSTMRDGFIGQGIFAIDWETPAQFSARTGIVIH